MVDDDHCRVTPPTDEDSEVVRQMKCFLLACMHRRNIDASFEGDMLTWISSYDPTEFRKAIAKAGTPVNRH